MKTLQKKVGRPTKLTEDMVTKLENIFKIGGTIDEACSYAGIAKESYYRYMEANPDFVTRMTAARHYADIAAKNIVIDTIVKDRNVDNAKWWLEKRQYNVPSSMVQVNSEKKDITVKIISAKNPENEDE